MSWHGIHGHDAIVAQFRRSLERNRLASTFLFVGPEGVGKHAFAQTLAQALLCNSRPSEALDPCGQCASCLQVAAGTHPDLIEVRRPADKSVIPVDLLIGSGDRRMQEGLCHDISLKPFMGGRRIAIIDDADSLNEEGANCLLKTLEEPPPQSVMILIGTSADRQLPTIRSRSQIVRFRPLPEDVLADLLMSEGVVSTLDDARRLARHSEGSLARARELADPGLWEFRGQLLERLASVPVENVRFAPVLSAFVDAAGKEAPLRRRRARQVVAFAAEFYRQVGRSLVAAQPTQDHELQQAVESAVATWPGDAEIAADCADRCLEALTHIERNANQSAWLECWLDDLGRLSSRQAV
jgi:DNA polymerase-3 subunit delta'